MTEQPLNETERQELERLREAVKARHSDRTLMYAQQLAGFIWTNTHDCRFRGDNTLLWAALPEETRQILIDFVMLNKKGPKRDTVSD